LIVIEQAEHDAAVTAALVYGVLIGLLLGYWLF